MTSFFIAIMNILSGNITDITTEDEISLVKVDAAGTTFTAIVIDTPVRSAYLTKGAPVRLLFKETEVMIATPAPLAISVQNRIRCQIKNIKSGKILCELTLGLEGSDSEIRSIITLNACKQLALQTGDNVIALIKTNEVSLSAHD
ncbi:MAG TPA: TOBE domain-containing protein [Puia sp.]|nr:TOBE domain-containing protein [Puia sp.]